MKSTRFFLCVAALFASAILLRASDKTSHTEDSKIVVLSSDNAPVDPVWLEKARAEYPLNTCPVSDDKLGGTDMGPAQDYVLREKGKPDRLIRFCCQDCVKDFKKDPAKYVKSIDDASAAKSKKK